MTIDPIYCALLSVYVTPKHSEKCVTMICASILTVVKCLMCEILISEDPRLSFISMSFCFTASMNLATIGIVAGCIAGVAVLIIIIVCCCRKRKQKQKAKDYEME